MKNRSNFNFKNAVFFPYGYEFTPFLSDLIKQKRIDSTVKLAAPKGWGITGQDAGEAFGRPKLGLQVTDDIKIELEKCKTFVALPYKAVQSEETNRYLDRLICENMDLARSKGKTTLDLREIIEDRNPVINKERDIDIECPVIFVNGTIEQVHKLDVMIELNNLLTKKGYKVSQIGTRHYCDILNMNSFPQFMLKPIPESKKVDLFKIFVQNIYEAEKPDVMVIGIPSASIPFNDNVGNGYGIMHFLISMAIRADFSITCTDYNFGNLEQLSTLYLHRFGHSIDCAVASNTRIFYDSLERPDKIIYEHLDYSKIDNHILKHSSNTKIPVFNIFNPQNVESMVDLLINELGNVEYFAL